tara:strand:- start:111195 stop:111809 length:615 start_codon:yes stop_codon:yes gene_type:complete
LKKYTYWFFLSILLIPSSISKAQSSELTSVPFKYKIEVFSLYSPTSMRFLGKTPDSQTSQFTIDLKKIFKQKSEDVFFTYKVHLTPYIGFDYSKRDDNGRKDYAHGFGLSPVGLGLVKVFNEKYQFVAETTGGFIYMNKVFPTDDAKRLNYTFDIKLAFDRKLYQSLGFSLGYKFHHISNAQTGEENPGLDSNFLFISLNYKIN